MVRFGLVFAVVLIVFLLGCVSYDGGGGEEYSGAVPKPVISKGSYSEGYDRTSSGLISGVRVGVDVTNNGAAGDVFVSVSSSSGNYNASKMFRLGEGETVSVRAYFPVLKRFFYETFTWTVRAASPGDASEGDVAVALKNQ